MTEHEHDMRSELQKHEEAETEAYNALPKASKVTQRLDSLLESLHHQVKHNAPIGPALVKEIEDIRALIG
jgi:hypothetical protein